MALPLVGLGIATLLAQVPVWLGALHQAGAVALLASVVTGACIGPGASPDAGDSSVIPGMVCSGCRRYL